MHTLKRMIYSLGFRPQFGSIWFSPSLDFRYSFEDYAKEVEEERRKDRWEKGYGGF